MKLDLIGYDNGFVKVISFLKRGRFGKTRSYRLWNCICKCGKEIILNSSQIRCCIPRGCCYQQKRPGNKYHHKQNTTHGLSKHPIYVVWMGIKARCYNKKNKAFKNYGERGINICDEWLNFEIFYKWAIGNNWRKGLTFDRLDRNKNYSPDNCHLISQSENSKKAVFENKYLNSAANVSPQSIRG